MSDKEGSAWPFVVGLIILTIIVLLVGCDKILYGVNACSDHYESIARIQECVEMDSCRVDPHDLYVLERSRSWVSKKCVRVG